MIKSSLSPSVKRMITKFTLIYILNCTDILFTYTFLKTGEFYEVNVLMQPIVSSPYLSILVKILLPGILILALLPRIQEENNWSTRLCHLCMSVVLLIYIFINCTHIYYLFTLLYFSS